MSKNGFDINVAIPCIMHAFEHAKKHPSLAADTGDVERSAKHFIQRALNNINGSSEFSQSMVASHLMGYTPFATSATFTFCFANRAIAHLFPGSVKESCNFTVVKSETSDKMKCVETGQHMNYAYRGRKMKDISLYFYSGICW
jgi:hypothetical protein